MIKQKILFILFNWGLFLSIAQCQRPLPKDLGGVGTTVGVPEPVIKWDFNQSDHDIMQDLSGQLVGEAKIENGKLCLTREGSYFKSDPLPINLKEKTMVAQVYLTTLDQRGGGLITVESLNGVTFDSIVYGEGRARVWNNGSEHGIRIKGNEGAEETAGPATPILMAVSYSKNGTIALYKNGEPYRRIIDPETPIQHYRKKKTHVLIGKRHEGGGNPYLLGKIEYAELYDEALGDAQIKRLYEKKRSENVSLKENRSTIQDQLPGKILLIVHEPFSDSLIQRAENGNAQAQMDLGYAYYYGKGVPKSCEQAVLWYEKSAAQNNANAINNLGACYANGEGVRQDIIKAASLYQKAAEAGFALGQDNYALMLCRGTGVSKDVSEAFRWHLKSALQGWYPAFSRVASHLEGGIGITQNQEAAKQWKELSINMKNEWESSGTAIDWRNNSHAGTQITNANASTNQGKPTIIRRRRVPVPTQSNSSQPSPKPDQIQSATDPQQNP
jgi:hypothetical protein